MTASPFGQPLATHSTRGNRCGESCPSRISRGDLVAAAHIAEVELNSGSEFLSDYCRPTRALLQGNADFQIGKHELYSKTTRKPGNTVFASLTRRVTKLRSFKN
jgi:hypothetical protein